MTDSRRNTVSIDSQQQYRLFVGGESVDPGSRRRFDSEDPFTGCVWASIACCDGEDVDRTLDAPSEAISEAA